MFNKVNMIFLINRRSNFSHVLIGILGLFFLVQTGLSQPESDGDKDYTINLENTDLQELIRFVADATGSTIVVDPSVKGKVNVISSEPITQAELYDLFLSILFPKFQISIGQGWPSRPVRPQAWSIKIWNLTKCVSEMIAITNDSYLF